MKNLPDFNFFQHCHTGGTAVSHADADDVVFLGRELCEVCRHLLSTAETGSVYSESIHCHCICCFDVTGRTFDL